MGSIPSKLGLLGRTLKRLMGASRGASSAPISPLKRIGGLAAALLTVLGVAIGWPEANEAMRSSSVREIEENLSLGLPEDVNLTEQSPAERVAHEARQRRTDELRALVRRHCADGIFGAGESRELLEWTYKSRYVGNNESLYQELLAEARRKEEIFPASLAPVVAAERERLCQATSAVREGVRLDKDGHTDAAREKFLEATRLDVGNVDAWLNLGNTFQTLGRLDKAESALRSAAALAPSGYKRFAVEYSLANCLARQPAQRQVALSQLEAALEVYVEEKLTAPDADDLRKDLQTSAEFQALRQDPDFKKLLGHPALAGQPAAAEPTAR